MRRMMVLLACVAGLALAGCGNDEPCGVTGAGTELCGGSAAAWCELIHGGTSVDSRTREFCLELDALYE